MTLGNDEDFYPDQKDTWDGKKKPKIEKSKPEPVPRTTTIIRPNYKGFSQPNETAKMRTTTDTETPLPKVKHSGVQGGGKKERMPYKKK